MTDDPKFGMRECGRRGDPVTYRISLHAPKEKTGEIFRLNGVRLTAPADTTWDSETLRWIPIKGAD